MAKTLRVDPVTRIEGHLAIEVEIDGSVISTARVAGRMFRGFEQLLLGRHPIDAARITQRICGICHEVHGIAASVALENLYQLRPPRNALILRDLILGLHLVTDHIFHFYQLTLPDYIDPALLRSYRGSDPRTERLQQIFNSSAGTFSQKPPPDAIKATDLTVEMLLAYVEAVEVRKLAGSGLASLGGKVPFCHAILPGGVTTDVTASHLMNYTNALQATSTFIDKHYLPQALVLAEHFPDYFNIGVSHGNFYSNGGFELLKDPLYSSGVLKADGTISTVRFDQIEERSEASFLDSSGLPDIDKKGAYSWVRALHYAGRAMEVGPLARLSLNRDPEFARLINRFGQKSGRSSVMARILARAYEAKKICSYLQQVTRLYRLDHPSIKQPDLHAEPTGKGTGMSLAARGALNHQVTVKDGKVTGYRLQVPSAWNFGPTVASVPGTVEHALQGTSLTSPAEKGKAIEVGRIVRSFDPCLACAIH